MFDCNVWLDVARITGPPFAWGTFDQVAAKYGGQPRGKPFRYYDSLRAIAVAKSGKFVGVQPLEVWTNDHIDNTVHFKARESPIPNPETGHRGLGWSTQDADSLLKLIDDLVEKTGGGQLTGTLPDGTPPLDHEDGMVYGACRYLAGEDLLARVWLVTNDNGFLKDYAAGLLGAHSTVLTPGKFVETIRTARRKASISHMRPPST